MTKSVLCAVDISNGEIDAPVIRQAAKLADLDGAQLDVITVVPDWGKSLVASFFESHHHDHVVQEADRQLRDLCVKVLGEDRNASVRHVVATGTAYEAILNTASKAGTDLIVIGAHKPDFKDYLLGPNAARVIRHSSCSVYVVR